jgi:hypothetical protein
MFFVFIHVITGAYPPLVIGLVYLALVPGIYALLLLALLVIDLCLFCFNVLVCAGDGSRSPIHSASTSKESLTPPNHRSLFFVVESYFVQAQKIAAVIVTITA